MNQRVAVLNVVGLCERHLGPATPRITTYARSHSIARIDPVLPGVTCSAQSTYLTGLPPASHGAVANGWYDRELSEVHFWKQSNHVVRGKKLWESLREVVPGITCAKLFWWYNMFSTADYSMTPRPMYPADGRKVFDVYSWPYDIRPAIKKDLGEFPFPGFWGPAAGVASPAGGRDCATQWIAASARWIEDKYSPDLSLVYLPHLDYNLQRWGPSDPRIEKDLGEIDEIVGDLLGFYERRGVRVALLSEYGITSVSRPVALNRVFRKEGWVVVKEELGREILDCGQSRVFAVADHQCAHVYVSDRSLLHQVRAVLERTEGVEFVWASEDAAAHGLNHSRSGDLVVMAAPDSWFTYYYWMEDSRAPDFARCVDIHRKPGYDPAELFLDPQLSAPRLHIAWRLLQKKLGFRMLMDVIPLQAECVRGSHGARPKDPADFPVLVLPGKPTMNRDIASTDVFGLLRALCLGEGR